MWRSTRFEIIRAIGRMRHQRGVEFLLRITWNLKDLPQAAEAVLALGETYSAVAGEYLLRLLLAKEYPLHREVVIALANMPLLPCEQELIAFIEGSAGTISPNLFQHVLLSLGRKGSNKAWSVVSRFLEEGVQVNQTPAFNAALLAAGYIGDSQALKTLNSLDTRRMPFTHELKLVSMERIHDRLRLSIEDVAELLLEASESLYQGQALQYLKAFPRELAWEACEILVAEDEVDILCLIRTALYDPKRAQADADFIVTHFDNLDLDIAAALIREHRKVDGEYLSALCSRLPIDAAIELYSRVRDRLAVVKLEWWVSNPDLNPATRVSAINAMVAQVHMAGHRSGVDTECGRLLMQSLDNVGQEHLKQRIIRAFGQIGYARKRVFNRLQKVISKNTSVYYSLSSMGGEFAARTILRRIKKLSAKEQDSKEMLEALIALSKMGKIPDTTPLTNLQIGQSAQKKIALLSIMCSNTVFGYLDLIYDELKGDDFHGQMLAIVAAKHNHDQRIMDCLFGFLDDHNEQLAERALDSICRGGGPEEHLRLIMRIRHDEKYQQRERALKIFLSLKPKPDMNYGPLVVEIDELLRLEYEIGLEQEVVAAAINFRDNLLLHSSQHFSKQPADKDLDQTQIYGFYKDTELSLTHVFEKYDSYSSSVKAVLRNAELTYLNPNLFDETVDKSTIVVEYVKSIDLILQDHFGNQIFSAPEQDLYTQMQTRVARLQFDQGFLGPAHAISELDCSTHYEPDMFPSYKLIAICQSIATGKFHEDGQNIIDGLRAWSVIFLLFARRFVYHQEVIEPILKVGLADNDRICKLSILLNRLQDKRNVAAHRGTLLRTSELEEVRCESFQVLAELGQIL
jgi:hypothetical protein